MQRVTQNRADKERPRVFVGHVSKMSCSIRSHTAQVASLVFDHL